MSASSPLTMPMLEPLKLEYVSQVEDANIFNYCFRTNGNLVIHYMTYDHHNEPRIVTELQPNGDTWDIVESIESHRRTKYGVDAEAEDKYDDMLVKHGLTGS
jgi:hypothetical protein